MLKIAKIYCLIVLSISISCKNTKKNEEQLSEKLSIQKNMIECDEIIVRLHQKKLDSITSVSYLPKSFEECLAQLDTIINDSLKLWVKCLPDGHFGNIIHQSFGMYLRNHWNLWSESDLVKSLNQLGIIHPDDMSAIILDSYQRKLKNEEILLDKQIKRYQEYWRETGFAVDSFLNEIEKTKKNP